MKTFLLIHLVMWLAFSAVVIIGGSVWSGFTPGYIAMCIPFLFFSHLQVLPFSIFAFLATFFIKSKFSFSVKKK